MKNFPLVKGGDGAAPVVAQPSGGCFEKRESRDSINRYRERRQIFELSSKFKTTPAPSAPPLF